MGKINRGWETAKMERLLTVSGTVVVAIFGRIFARQMTRLFGIANAEVKNAGICYLWICCGINSLLYTIM